MLAGRDLFVLIGSCMS